MAFNPNKHKGLNTQEKSLPIVLLLDVSNSMNREMMNSSDGKKIDVLYRATNLMIEELEKQAKTQECGFKVAVITFGNNVELHTPYTDVKDIKGRLAPFSANGMTPLGHALDLAKDMIDDKSVTLGRWYRPAVVLISDGFPTDDYKSIMNSFINDGRTSKCQRFSVGIGNEDSVDFDMLRSFVSVPENCKKAENATEIVAALKFVTMSVSSRSASGNPNVFAGATSGTSNKENSVNAPTIDDDDDDCT